MSTPTTQQRIEQALDEIGSKAVDSILYRQHQKHLGEEVDQQFIDQLKGEARKALHALLLAVQDEQKEKSIKHILFSSKPLNCIKPNDIDYAYNPTKEKA